MWFDVQNHWINLTNNIETQKVLMVIESNSLKTKYGICQRPIGQLEIYNLII